MKIGVFDSGIGGFTILHQMMQDSPGHEYVYLADQAHAPYSQKSIEALIRICSDNVTWLLAQGCETIVVACNTATVMTIAELRRQWPEVPFIGTVPAVKPASEQTVRGATVAVLATKNTVESAFLANLLQPYRKQTQFQLLGTTRLVECIEAEAWPAAQDEVSQLLAPFDGLAGVVLGCTHFPLVISEIQRVTPKGVLFFTPNQGVSDRLVAVVGTASGAGSVRFHSTAGSDLESLWNRLQPRLNTSAQSVRLQSR